MRPQRRTRTINLALGALVAMLLTLALGATTAGAAVDSAPVSSPAAAAKAYWTKARMRAAVPADPVPSELAPEAGDAPAAPATGAPSYVPAAAPAQARNATLQSGSAPAVAPLPLGSSREVSGPSAPGVRAHGKVFFTIPGEGDFVCSGTAVNSRNRSVVWTAGHCVYDAGPRSQGYTNAFSTNFIFVPAYRDGQAPFGRWAARRLATTTRWESSANLKYDFGAAIVRKHGVRRLQGVVGARGIGFSQPRGQVLEAFGYPAVAPFTGEREFSCTDAPTSGDPRNPRPGPRPLRIDCDMTAGASGGGWITGTTLVSVTSYGYDDQVNDLYGSYMANAARHLYKSVRGHRKRAVRTAPAAP